MTPEMVAFEDVLRTTRATAFPPRLRSLSQFARDEISLPNGPFEGRRIRREYQPAHFEWFEAVDAAIRGKTYNRFAMVAPVQSGKTLAGMVAPMLWVLFEWGETVILGAPTEEIAHDKLRQDIMPVLRRTRYFELMPTTGRGAKGGFINSDHIAFGNGAELKIMSGGGNDAARSGYSSRWVFVTETDKMDTPTASSREASPVDQLIDRTRAFDRHGGAFVFLECTASQSGGRIWQEWLTGTQSRFAIDCPRCRRAVVLERRHFRGWEQADSAKNAGRLARWHCPSCSTPWTEAERFAAAQTARIWHCDSPAGDDWQSAAWSADAVPRDTHTLSVRLGAAENCFVTDATMASDAWATLSDDLSARREAEKTCQQKTFAEPWDGQEVAIEGLLRWQDVAARVSGLGRGELPPACRLVTRGVDVGARWLHWATVAWAEDGSGWIVDYGREGTGAAQTEKHERSKQDAQREAIELVPQALGALHAQLLAASAETWVDVGWGPLYDVLVATVRRVGWVATKGFGQTAKDGLARTTYRCPEAVERWAGGHKPPADSRGSQYVLSLDPDYTLGQIHQRLRIQPGNAGALVLWGTSPAEHRPFAQQLCAQQLATVEGITKWRYFTPAGGEVKSPEPNHWLDAVGLAASAAARRGVRIGAAVSPASTRRLVSLEELARMGVSSRG